MREFAALMMAEHHKTFGVVTLVSRNMRRASNSFSAVSLTKQLSGSEVSHSGASSSCSSVVSAAFSLRFWASK